MRLHSKFLFIWTFFITVTLRYALEMAEHETPPMSTIIHISIIQWKKARIVPTCLCFKQLQIPLFLEFGLENRAGTNGSYGLSNIAVKTYTAVITGNVSMRRTQWVPQCMLSSKLVSERCELDAPCCCFYIKRDCTLSCSFKKLRILVLY